MPELIPASVGVLGGGPATIGAGGLDIAGDLQIGGGSPWFDVTHDLFGASVDASASYNKGAIEEAIAAALDGGDGSALSEAVGSVYVPPGLFRVEPMRVKSAFGFRLCGASQYATRFLVKGSGGASLFDLDGVPHCTFERFAISGDSYSASDSVENAIHLHWSGVAGAGTRRVTMREVYITELYFVNGIAIETLDSNRQNDEITLQDFTIDGGTNPLSPDATWWRAGVRIGETGEVSGNTFQVLMLKPGIQQCRSGVQTLGTSFHSYGGGFQANTFDFNLHGLWLNSVVEGLRSEQATRLLTDEVGYSGTPASMMLRNIWWNGANAHADGDFVLWKMAGTLDLENIHVTSAPHDLFVNAANGALGHTITRIKGMKNRTAPGSLTYGEDATRQHIIEDYTQTNAGGDDTTAFFPGRLYLPVAASAVANNTLFRDSADGKLKYKDNAGATQVLY